MIIVTRRVQRVRRAPKSPYFPDPIPGVGRPPEIHQNYIRERVWGEVRGLTPYPRERDIMLQLLMTNPRYARELGIDIGKIFREGIEYTRQRTKGRARWNPGYGWYW